MRCLISTLIGTRKSCSGVISMLMSRSQVMLVHILPCLRESLYEESHQHAHRHMKSCSSVVISMLMSISSDVGTYMYIGVLMRIPM